MLDRTGGSIAFRFHARDAHLVLPPGAREPIPFRVLLDGKAPGPSHCVDVDEDGNGLLRDGRIYQLVRQHDPVRERALEITFLEPAEAYVFTFGYVRRLMNGERLMVVGNSMEAETICGLLRTEGIACYHRQTDMGAGAGDAVGDSGPREILVARDDLDSARQLVTTDAS